uniref:Centrosomal protein of 162 kDa n=2 Tax=Macrostomum lignano TaxID=282301 RepID=A0A1I8G4M9_9PLAT
SELRKLAVRLADAEEAADAARAESSLLRDRLAEREAEAEALVLAVDEQRLRAAAAGRPGGAPNSEANDGDALSTDAEAGDARQLVERGNSLFAELEDRRVKAELRVVELQQGVAQLRDRLAKKDAEAAEMRCLFAARMRERARPAYNAQYVADLEQEAAWSRQQIEALQRKVQLLEVSQNANKLQSASVLRTFERTCGFNSAAAPAASSASSLLQASAAAQGRGVTLEARLAECQEALRSRELECCSLRNTKL